MNGSKIIQNKNKREKKEKKRIATHNKQIFEIYYTLIKSLSEGIINFVAS